MAIPFSYRQIGQQNLLFEFSCDAWNEWLWLWGKAGTRADVMVEPHCDSSFFFFFFLHLTEGMLAVSAITFG